MHRYFSSTRLMSPRYRLAMSPGVDEKSKIYQVDYMDKQTPRQVANKHAYAHLFGSSELSKILVNNKGSKNPLDGLIKKTL